MTRLTNTIAVLALGAAIAAPALSATTAKTPAGPPAASGRFAKDGIVLEFEARPVGSKKNELKEGGLAEIQLRLTEEATGKPVRGVTPGAWMDIAEVIQGRPKDDQKSCKDKIALYLKGVVGIRPMLDLNSYYVMVLNSEPSISVIDPLVSMVGSTSTLTTIRLKSTGADWAKSADERILYVSMPKAGEVAVIDADTFKVTQSVPAGEMATRVALQPDGRFLWVGNNAKDPAQSGVTIIDTASLKPVGSIKTGAGHHELAFSEDSRYAFVSNRDGGTLTVIDVADRKVIGQIPTGPVPLSVAYSPLSRMAYVADGKTGSISVVDPKKRAVAKHIELKPGLGPMRVSPDGRWAFALNPSEDEVYVIDTSGNALQHTIKVAGQPYQVVFSRAFAYVRSIASERVSMINLSTVGEGKSPTVQSFVAGNVPPSAGGSLVIADTISPASTEAAVLVVNPGDNTTYFYMEGMNAPSSNYKTLGAHARAVTVMDRSLHEVEPGLYKTVVKIPAAGKYDLAVALDTPQMLHCFSAEAKADPTIAKHRSPLAVEYLVEERVVSAGSDVAFRFRLTDPATGKVRTGLKDARILYYRAPGQDRSEIAATEVGDGVYEAKLSLRQPGAYMVYVGVPSANLPYGEVTHLSLVVRKEKPAAKYNGAPTKDRNG